MLTKLTFSFFESETKVPSDMTLCVVILLNRDREGSSWLSERGTENGYARSWWNDSFRNCNWTEWIEKQRYKSQGELDGSKYCSDLVNCTKSGVGWRKKQPDKVIGGITEERKGEDRKEEGTGMGDKSEKRKVCTTWRWRQNVQSEDQRTDERSGHP